jgi:hypothetical protein
VARLLRYYPSLGYDRVWTAFPMDKGYALIAAAMSCDPWTAFAGIKMEGGYVEGELNNLVKKKLKNG